MGNSRGVCRLRYGKAGGTRVAIAEEVEQADPVLWARVENRPATIEQLIKAGAALQETAGLLRGRRVTGFIGRCRPWDMTAWWWRRR